MSAGLLQGVLHGAWQASMLLTDKDLPAVSIAGPKFL